MSEAAASMPSATFLAAIERCRRRVWTLCYRMTGSRADADDLAQESIARAIEREPQQTDPATTEGWLLRIATTTCLDHLRRQARVRRVTDLVDPLDLPDLIAAGPAVPDPEAVAIRRDDVRFAVVVALQTLPANQRAVLILHDVCDRPLAEVARTLTVSPDATKALLHRARARLIRERARTDCDVVADRDVVERFARAIAAYALDDIASLCSSDVWGVVDGGTEIRVATKPSVGRRAVVQRFSNAVRALGPIPLATSVRQVNGEPTVLIVQPTLGGTPFALVHLETLDGTIRAIRVVRDPRKLAPFATTEH